MYVHGKLSTFAVACSRENPFKPLDRHSRSIACFFNPSKVIVEIK